MPGAFTVLSGPGTCKYFPKRLIVNILGFEGQMVSGPSTQLWHCSTKANINNTQMNKAKCLPPWSMVFDPKSILEFPERLVKTVSFSAGLGSSRECTFLTSSQAMLIELGQEPHFENHYIADTKEHSSVAK